MKAPRIRPAVLDDAAALHRIVLRLLPALTVDPGGEGAERFLESVTRERMGAAVEDPRYEYLVAVASDEVIGFIAMRDVSHLFHLFVLPEYQGQRLARRLWDAARQRAEAAGHHGDYTVNSSLGAVPVYESFGFVVDGPVTEKHGVAFVPMTRRPAPPGSL